MNNSEIAEIVDEANKLITKEYPLLKNDIKDYTVEYILKAMDNLGYRVRKK